MALREFALQSCLALHLACSSSLALAQRAELESASPGDLSAATDEPNAAAEPGDATGPSEADIERARALFGEGLQFVETEDWFQAEQRFREVLEIRASHVVSYNLASALVHLGRLVESSELLEAVLADPSADTQSRLAAQQLLLEIQPRIGSLTVRVAGDTTDSLLALDGRRIELVGDSVTLRVDPGPHEVSVERDGEVILSPHVDIGGDMPLRAQVLLELPARKPLIPLARIPAAEPGPRSLMLTPEERRDDDGGLLSEWWLWAGVGTLAAAIVVGTLALSSDGSHRPVSGDTDPPVIHVRVAGGMP